MKHIILSLLLLLCCTTSSADTLVTPPAEDVAKTYYAMGYSYAQSDNRSFEIRVVRSGDDIFIQGLYESLPEAWIKGTMNGDIASFPSSQYLGTVDPALVDESHEEFDVYMFCSTDLQSTRDLQIKYNPLNDTYEAYYQYILFSEKDDIRARFEHLQNLSFFSGQKVKTTAPEGLKTVSYRLNAYECSLGKNMEYFVELGMQDDMVYVRGISEAFPNEWVCGKLEGDRVHFMRNQYLGTYVLGFKTYNIWFTGINHDEAYFTEVILQYDEDTGIFSQIKGNWLVINGDPAQWRWLNNMSDVVLTPDDGIDRPDDEAKPIVPPLGLTTTTFHVSGADYSFDSDNGDPLAPYDVEMGFSGSTAYVKGLFTDMPEAWIKGTFDGTRLTFTSPQYLGKWYDTMDCWLMGIYDFDSVRDIVFTYRPDEAAFVLDPDTRIFFNDDSQIISDMPFLAIGNITLKGNLPAGIAALSSKTYDGQAAIYNAAGAASTMRSPGIYITRGKKIMVK